VPLGLPLLPPLVVTTAVRLPKAGGALKVTVSWVEVAAVTVPEPVLKLTVLLPGVVSKPVPLMVIVGEEVAK
jgi:hypothetical protein